MDHLIFDGGGALIRKKYRAFPKLMKKIMSTKPIYYKNSEKISCGADKVRKTSRTFKKAPPSPIKNQMVRP
jgi:hypothetical protein